MLYFFHFLPNTQEIPINTHLHCKQELFNWYFLFPSHQLFMASHMIWFFRAIKRIKFYWLFHCIVWFLYQSAHFWNGISWAWHRWYQCAFWVLFYGVNNFLFCFPFANTSFAKMSRYSELSCYLYNPLTGQLGRKYFQSRKVLNILSYLVVKRTFYLLIFLSYFFAKVVKCMALARIIALILIFDSFY